MLSQNLHLEDWMEKRKQQCPTVAWLSKFRCSKVPFGNSHLQRKGSDMCLTATPGQALLSSLTHRKEN